jgi:hypothetical protein
MSQNQTTIRLYEAFITILGSYLAVSSFFNSSLYKTIASGLSVLLRIFHIQTLSSQQITTIIPLLVTLFVSLLIVYDYIMGKPDNIINIYQLNLVLITPEILSYSKLDWLNLIQKPQILEPTRSSTTTYFSGAIILLGYLSLYFISISRKTSKELTTRGIEPSSINEIFMRQSTLSITLAGVAAAVASFIFLSIEPLDTLLQALLGQRPYNYLAYGVPGVALILLSLWFYLREQGKVEEN